MKFKIETVKMNAMLSKAGKGVGEGKLIPITAYLNMVLDEEGKLHITATDSVNFITVKSGEIKGEAGSAVVYAEKLIKLTAKTTKPEMSFEVKGDKLEVKGNGTYTVELNTEDAFPQYQEAEAEATSNLKVQKLKKALDVNEAAISVDASVMPCLTGFNLGETVTTTDGVKMCINQQQIFKGDSVLLPQPLANLLDTLQSEDVTVSKAGKHLYFKTDTVDIYGVQLEGLDDFPDITGLLSLEHPHEVVVPRTELIGVLERMSLFVDKFDNYATKLTFGESLQVQDIKQNNTETLEFKKGAGDGTTVIVSIVYLQQLLASLSDDYVTVAYGEDMPVKISQPDVVQLISTIDEEDDMNEEGNDDE